MTLSPEQLIRPEILRLAAYHVPDATGMVKLDAMENPYRLPAEMARELGETLAGAAINRYPDPRAGELKAVLREAFAIPAGLEIMLGNGSDELIQILALALSRPGATLLGVEPSFVMYRMIAEFTGMRYVGVPLRADFSLDEAAMQAAIAEHRPALVFLAYPNNPTGNAFDRQALRRMIQATPGLVVMDEAYHAFAGGLSFLDEVERHDNLLLMRTVSKLGLAGLRLGYLVGPPRWLAELDKLRLPYNVGVLTQLAAGFALDRISALEAQAAAIVAERGRLLDALRGVPGVVAHDSLANFLLLRVADAPGVFAGLKRRGVLIKCLHGAHPLLDGCLRVTVGTPQENQAFMDAFTAELETRR
ncbi:MAG: histidinol-phosphate transaminase [Thiobacillaceae bacterium]|jgi:histidinol-phosphate aminotransferase|nr:histidinol-phosphate transaminase [Thiobacillaceae bacterium]